MNRFFMIALPIVLRFAAECGAQTLPTAELGLLPGDSVIAPATNSQQEHSVARGGDQYLVVWSDYRGRSSGSQSIQSDGDIFGIRLDANGQPIDAAPFLIGGGMGLQREPLVAWNGSAWLVLYISQEPVEGYYGDEIRAARVSSSGQLLDPTPIIVPSTQFTPNNIGIRLAGQQGQWLMTRCVYHSDGYGTFLAGQRIAGDGTLVDAAPVMLIDWVYGPTALVVANGEYLAAGPDWNQGWVNKARRVGLNNQPIGAPFDVPGLNIAGNGSEYYVSWIADYVNLVGSRMTLAGTLLTPAGTALVSNFSTYNQSTLAHDGTNWWLEWGASDQLRTVRINAAGTVLDPGGGVLLPITIGGNVNNAYQPALVSKPGGGVHLFWYDLRVALGYDTNVFSMPISAQNTAGVERLVSTSTPNQRNPDLSDGPAGSAAVVFVSEAANDDRVMVHLLSAADAATNPQPIEVARAATIGKAGIAWNGSLFMVAWDQGSSGQNPTAIQARRMNPDGSFVDAAPIAVMPGFNADIEALGSDFLVAGARFGAYPQNIGLHGNRVSGTSGAVLDGPNGVYLSGAVGAGYVSEVPRVRSDGARWLVAAGSKWTHDSSQGDAILAMVSSTGIVTPAFNPTPFSGASGDLDIAFSGTEYLLVWRMNSLANANNYIAGRMMNTDGTFPPGYFIIAEAAGRQLRPAVAWDGVTFVVTWEDQRNQGSFFDARTDIYAARVTESGVVLDAVAFPVCATPNGDATAAILPRGAGRSLVATARFATTALLDSYRVGLTRLGIILIMGDANGDLAVDFSDISVVLARWGTLGPIGDANHDHSVDFSDITAVLANFGTTY